MSMLPENVITIEMPEMLNPTGSARSRVNVIHGQAVKEAGKFSLIRHQVETLPGHFEIPARTLYSHHERSPGVRAYKAKHGQPDNVKRGRTRYRMTKRPPHSLRASGTAAGGFISFKMTLKFPFPGSSMSSDPRTVTQEKMAKEISTVVPSEQKLMAKNFRDKYVELILLKLKPRMRKKLTASGRLGALGII